MTDWTGVSAAQHGDIDHTGIPGVDGGSPPSPASLGRLYVVADPISNIANNVITSLHWTGQNELVGSDIRVNPTEDRQIDTLTNGIYTMNLQVSMQTAGVGVDAHLQIQGQLYGTLKCAPSKYSGGGYRATLLISRTYYCFAGDNIVVYGETYMATTGAAWDITSAYLTVQRIA